MFMLVPSGQVLWNNNDVQGPNLRKLKGLQILEKDDKVSKLIVNYIELKLVKLGRY